MIQFTKINIEGFASIPELSLDLNTQGITIIRGVNGSGKSSIFSALVWVLYGKNPKGNSSVNTWSKFMPKKYLGTKVEIFFVKRNQVHRVVRCQNYKGDVDGARGNSRLIYEIDTNPVNGKYKNHIQEQIEHNLGMSYNLFINSVMFGQGLTRLIEASGSDQKKLFEELFSTEYLTRARDIAKQEYAKYELEYTQISYKIDVLNKQRIQLESSIEYAERYERIETKKREEKLQYLRKERESTKKSLRDLAKGMDGDVQEKLSLEISSIQEFIVKNQEQISKAKSRTGISLEKLINQVISLLENREYDSSLKLLRDIKSAFSKIESCRAKIDSLQKTLARLKDKQIEYNHLIHQIDNFKRKNKNIRQQIRDIRETPIISKPTKMQKKQLSEVNEELSQLKENTSSFHMMELYKWAYTDPLGNGGIKAFLFESSLYGINQSLERYSNLLGFSITLGVDLESSRKDFVISINMEGQEVDFDDLSGGQKQLVNLAIAFAMNEAMNQSKGVNIAFLDEVFESLSSNNIELVSEMIRKIYKNKTLFLITHQESLPINAKVLKVNRIKGLSYYDF